MSKIISGSTPTDQPHQTKTTLSRMLLSIDGEPCSFGCTYCFASFGQYVAPRTLSEVERVPELCSGVDVLYPACDTDLFARADFEEVIERVAVFGLSVSISTKAFIGRRALSALKGLDKHLNGRGSSLKVGISISTKHSVREIEPRTPSYESRVRSLGALQSAGIESALILRPLLAEIEDSEYQEILRDCEGLTTRVLVGDEWLDRGDRSREVQRAEKSSVIRLNEVNWAKNHPIWSQRSVPGRVNKLRDFGKSLGYQFFESDLELMEDIIRA